MGDAGEPGSASSSPSFSHRLCATTRGEKICQAPDGGPQGQKPGSNSSPSHITSGGQNGPQSMRHISRTREAPPGGLVRRGGDEQPRPFEQRGARNNAEANAGELETRTGRRRGGGGTHWTFFPFARFVVVTRDSSSPVQFGPLGSSLFLMGNTFSQTRFPLPATLRQANQSSLRFVPGLKKELTPTPARFPRGPPRSSGPGFVPAKKTGGPTIAGPCPVGR